MAPCIAGSESVEYPLQCLSTCTFPVDCGGGGIWRAVSRLGGAEDVDAYGYEETAGLIRDERDSVPATIRWRVR